MDLLAKIIAYLASVLDVPVATDFPATPPASMVVVSRTGGSADRFLQSPRLTVTATAESDLAASTLLAEVCAACLEMPDHMDEVCTAAIGSTYSAFADGAFAWAAEVSLLAYSEYSD